MTLFVKGSKKPRMYPQPVKGGRIPALPSGRAPMLHQAEGVVYMSERDHWALFMEMRLGKTLTTLLEVKRRGLRRCLIVAPLTVLVAWEKELAAEGEVAVKGYGLSPKKREEAIYRAFHPEKEGRTWLLMNYESVLAMCPKRTVKRRGKEVTVRDLPDISYLPWDFVGLDESTKIRNPQTYTSELFVDGFRSAKHRACLTGLPSPESELDLFQQMKFLYGRFMGCSNYWQFRSQYFEPAADGYAEWIPKPGTLAKIKAEVHHMAFVRRRSQCKMHDKKVYEVRTVQMNVAQRRLYREIESEYAATLQSGEVLETDWAMTRHLWMCRLAGGFDPDGALVSTTKKDELMDLLKGELRQEKAVVWFRFRNEVDLIADALTQAHIPFVKILGGTPQEERSKKINYFSEKGGARVMLATEKVAQYGIDASAASVAIYYSNEPSCEARAQSEDRIVHPKKKETLLIIDMVTEASVDEDLEILVKDKTLNAKMMMIKFKEKVEERIYDAFIRQAEEKTRSVAG